MSPDAKKYLDLSPFLPRKPLYTIPARDDGTKQSPSGLADGDMVSGSSEGENNSKLKTTLPPVTYAEDGSPNRRA